MSRWLAALLGAWAAVAIARVVWALWDPPSANVAALNPANLATWTMCYALGLLGNVAYLGMVLDRVRSSEARAQALAAPPGHWMVSDTTPVMTAIGWASRRKPE